MRTKAKTTITAVGTKRSREALNFKLRTACANDFDRCIFCVCAGSLVWLRKIRVSRGSGNSSSSLHSQSHSFFHPSWLIQSFLVSISIAHYCVLFLAYFSLLIVSVYAITKRALGPFQCFRSVHKIESGSQTKPASQLYIVHAQISRGANKIAHFQH